MSQMTERAQKREIVWQCRGGGSQDAVEYPLTGEIVFAYGATDGSTLTVKLAAHGPGLAAFEALERLNNDRESHNVIGRAVLGVQADAS